MPVFSSPIWLLALSAFVLPVIIHLWNDRNGRVYFTGSVRLLEKEARRQSRTLRLSEKWLLLVRCLLLSVLALLLAGPMWKRRGDGRVQGWVLTGDSAILHGQYREQIDSLLKKGYVRKEFLPGDAVGNWWQEFTRFDRLAPAGVPFYIFSDGRAVHFRGARPSSFRDVHWEVDTAGYAASLLRPVAAWKGVGDSVLVQRLESRATGSVYHVAGVAGPAFAGIAVDTHVLTVHVFTDPGSVQDGRYVAAALRAVKQYSRRNLRVTISDTKGGSGAGDDWAIWLSERPCPVSIGPRNLLCYAPGKGDVVHTMLYGDGASWPVTKMIVDTMSAGVASIWRDGFERPLLTVDSTKGRLIYRLYTHFDPSWNGLAFSGAMPLLLGNLILGHSGKLDVSEDLRVLDPSQIRPLRRDGGAGADVAAGVGTDAGAVMTDLGPYCWILLILLFVAERILSHRNIPKNSHG